MIRPIGYIGNCNTRLSVFGPFVLNCDFQKAEQLFFNNLILTGFQLTIFH